MTTIFSKQSQKAATLHTLVEDKLQKHQWSADPTKLCKQASSTPTATLELLDSKAQAARVGQNTLLRLPSSLKICVPTVACLQPCLQLVSSWELYPEDSDEDLPTQLQANCMSVSLQVIDTFSLFAYSPDSWNMQHSVKESSLSVSKALSIYI